MRARVRTNGHGAQIEQTEHNRACALNNCDSPVPQHLLISVVRRAAHLCTPACVRERESERLRFRHACARATANQSF